MHLLFFLPLNAFHFLCPFPANLDRVPFLIHNEVPFHNYVTYQFANTIVVIHFNCHMQAFSFIQVPTSVCHSPTLSHLAVNDFKLWQSYFFSSVHFFCALTIMSQCPPHTYPTTWCTSEFRSPFFSLHLLHFHSIAFYNTAPVPPLMKLCT